MSLSTSSAEPLKLLRYSDTMVLVDDALGAEANRLRGALEHFEATCREPAFRLRVSHVADSLVQYAQQARGIDLWVRDVAVGFQLADSGGVYDAATDAQMCLLPVSAAGAAKDLPDESEEAVKQWLEENQGKYTSFEEWQQAFIARFPYMAVAMGLTLTADQWHRIFDYGHQAWEVGDDTLKIYRTLKVRPGFAYAGQKILSGGKYIKDLAGWSKNLTHLKFPNASQFAEIMTSHNVGNLVGQSAWKEMKGTLKPASKAGWALFAVGVAITGFENWGEYHDKGGGSKVVSGTLVDTAIDLEYAALGAGIGAVIGGGIGAFGGPAGLIVGVKIGGFVGSIAGGFYATHVKNTSDVDETLTDQLDEIMPDWMDEGLDKAGEKVDAAAQFVGDAFNSASLAVGATVVGSAARVEAALAPAIQNIAKLF